MPSSNKTKENPAGKLSMDSKNNHPTPFFKNMRRSQTLPTPRSGIYMKQQHQATQNHNQHHLAHDYYIFTLKPITDSLILLVIQLSSICILRVYVTSFCKTMRWTRALDTSSNGQLIPSSSFFISPVVVIVKLSNDMVRSTVKPA
jgi:hypothetical protein